MSDRYQEVWEEVKSSSIEPKSAKKFKLFPPTLSDLWNKGASSSTSGRELRKRSRYSMMMEAGHGPDCEKARHLVSSRKAVTS